MELPIFMRDDIPAITTGKSRFISASIVITVCQITTQCHYNNILFSEAYDIKIIMKHSKNIISK